MPTIFKKLDKLKPVYDAAYKVVLSICKVLLIADILVTIYMVIGRYLPFIPAPVWGEQVVLTLMVYMTVLSATLAIRRNAHIRMTALDKYLPVNLVKSLDLLADIAVTALGVILLIYGIKVCDSPMARLGKYDSLPWLGRVWMYVPIPVAGATMIIFELEQICLHIKAFFIKGDSKDEEVKIEAKNEVNKEVTA